MTFRNVVTGKTVDVLNAVSSSGARFPVPGSLAPEKSPLQGGKTEGTIPDDRQLPEWVEFEWKEWPYPYPKMPTKPGARRAWEAEVHAQSQALPRKTAKVAVRSRIPREVVDEVRQSKRQRQPGKLPEKSLWVYFVWFDSGIKFRWELRRECCEVLRAGGDEIVP